MKRRSVTFLAVSMATIMSVLTAALAAGTAIWSVRKKFEDGVRTCVAAISAQHPQRNALEDFKRGEQRFFFQNTSEWDLLQGVAPGVMSERLASGRTVEKCGTATVGLRTPFPLFRRFIRMGRGSDPYRIDPFYSPRTACGRANDEYIRAYNVEMARVSPASVASYCR